MNVLKDYCLNITDGEHGTVVDTVDGEYYLLSNKNIVNGNIKITETDRKISKETYDKLNKRTNLKIGCVLIATVGTIGKSMVISKNPNYTVQRSIGIITPNDKLLDPYFLKYYLDSPIMKKRIEYATKGAVQKCLFIEDLKNLEVDIPSLNEQKRIVSVLKTIDDKIMLNKSICLDLESMVELLYDYWFIQFDFPDENGQPYKISGGKMVWNDELKREIPEGWEVKELHKCIDTIIDRRGVTPKKLGADWVDNGIIALSAKVVKNGHLLDLANANRVSKELYDKWMPQKLMNGDILMTSEAPLGEFYYMYNEPDYCLSQRLFAIRANESVSSLYLYYELSRGNGISQINGKSSGSTVSGIRQDELRKVKIAIPNIKIMQVFHKKAIFFVTKCHELDKESQELVSLRDFLLPMLMNGQIKIEDIKCSI